MSANIQSKTMLFLLYLRNGFIKKYPLDNKSIFLGRSIENDFYINEPFISHRHAKIETFANHITIEDLNSTNGIYVDYRIIKKAKVEINGSFRIGYLNFILKKGNAQEFVLSTRVQPMLNRITKMLSAKADETQETINLLYAEPLIEMLQIGFKLEKFVDLFAQAKTLLENMLKTGCLMLLSKMELMGIKIESHWNFQENWHPVLQSIQKNPDLFDKICSNQRVLDRFIYCSFPVPATQRSIILLYVIETDSVLPEKLVEFLGDLATEISLIETLIESNHQASGKANSNHEVPEIITKNQPMLNLLSKLNKIAKSNLFVMIEGETGTGKELLAKFIHTQSKQKKGNFVALNCAAIPENLMEAELFGYEKGAFTDAKSQRQGKLELSSGGTLILDEIADMPISLQKKLLRAIQEGQFYRVGGSESIHVDLRIICLSNREISSLIREGQFRQDLYYRLAHVTLKVPSLRDRKEDIVPLINHFVKNFSSENQVTIKGFSREAISALETYNWPGNIRELENEINKIVSLAEDGDIIDLNLLKDEIIQHYQLATPLQSITKNQEKTLLHNLLEKHKWNKTLVAKELNISRTALYEKLKKFDIS